MPMDYLFIGEPGPCTPQISEEWHRCSSLMLRKGFWWVRKGFWGKLHIYNPGHNNHNWDKSISKPCACVSVCPCVLAWAMCAYSAHGYVDTHMWRPETVITCTPQSLSTLNAEFWSFTGWLICLVWLARLPWEFPTSTVQMLGSQVGCLPSIQVSTRGQTLSLSLKLAPPRMFVCCLLGYRVERCSSYTMQCKGTISRNGVKKWVPRISGGVL